MLPPLCLLSPPYYSLFIASCLSSSLIVQLGSSSAYRVGQAVGLQRRLRWGGLLRAPKQWCSAGRGEEEQQEATFFHLSHHVPQTHASSSPSAALHGDQRAGSHQLQQPHSGCPNWRDQRGAFLQRTFTGKRVKENCCCIAGPSLEVELCVDQKQTAHSWKHAVWQITSIL